MHYCLPLKEQNSCSQACEKTAFADGSFIDKTLFIPHFSSKWLDLPKVYLINFRVEYVRPQSGRCLAREPAERMTKSREVDLSRLKDFHLRFAPKMRSGVTCNWCLRLHFKVLEESVPFRLTKIIECVYVSPRSIERANLFTLHKSCYEKRF